MGPTPRLPVVSGAGLGITAGADVIPMPSIWTLCGLLPALSLIFIRTLQSPMAAGVNVASIVQAACGASVAGIRGQVVVSAKSATFLPVRVMLLIVKATVPELVSVVVCLALVVPIR